MAQLALYSGVSKITTGGIPVVSIIAGSLGGIIANPLTAADQGINVSENLYLDLTGPATTYESATTFILPPGKSYSIPDNLTKPVWVNAKTDGHLFNSIFYANPTQYPPTPIVGPFPPNGLTTQTALIPSYLYQEYNDDDDLQSFVASFNLLAQNYIDTLNGLNLPIYTDLNISGGLLDWVGEGLYGLPRPTLSSGRIRSVGPFNTFALNTLAFNSLKKISNVVVIATSDDIYKRILTWHFYKGDGKVFNIRWLKRRIMRFINGANGTAPNVDNTDQVSISFGVNYQVNITIVGSTRRLTGGALFNRFIINQKAFNAFTTIGYSQPPLNSAELVEALNSGDLELPFQFTYVVNIT